MNRISKNTKLCTLYCMKNRQLSMMFLEGRSHTLQLPMLTKTQEPCYANLKQNYVSFKILLNTYSVSNIQLRRYCLHSDQNVPLLKLTSVFNLIKNIPLCLYINQLISESPQNTMKYIISNINYTNQLSLDTILINSKKNVRSNMKCIHRVFYPPILIFIHSLMMDHQD